MGHRRMIRGAFAALLCGLVMTGAQGQGSEIKSGVNGNMNQTQSPQAPDQLVRDSYVAFFPLYEMARLRYLSVEAPVARQQGEINTLGHVRALLDDRARTVTAPNNDTLYSSARLDLRLGPLIIETPAIAERYYSLHFMNMYTDNVAILGRRVGGDGPLRVAVVGPGWTGDIPPHSHRVNSDTNDMWLLVRVLVDGPDDIARVASLQDAMHIRAPQAASAYPLIRTRPVKDPGPDVFVDVVNEMLERNPPQGAMAGRARAAATLGLGQGKRWAQLPPDVQAIWTNAWAKATGELLRPAAIPFRRSGGWQLPPPNVGQWGDNLLMRATVALRGIAALDSAETMYMSTLQDVHDKPLSGERRYTIRIPAGGVPVNGFWSLTMYEALPDGRFFLTPNVLNRFSIGNRTKGLRVEPDGSIVLQVQHAEPADRTNWLPAPKGPFRMSIRAYLPKPELVRGEVPLPRVEAITD